MDVDEIRVRIDARYERFADFINADVLNLYGALSLLVQRLHESGLTAEEARVPSNVEAATWALGRSESRVAEVMVVSLWSALEVYIEDLFLDVAPHVVVEPTQDVRKVTAPIVELLGLPQADIYRRLWSAVEKKGEGAKRYDRALATIGIAVDISEEWPEVLDDKVNNSWTRSALYELHQVRNVILHRGGTIDEPLASLRPNVWRVGELLNLSWESLIRYGVAVHAYGGSALHAAYVRLGIPTDPTRTAEPGAPNDFAR